jgi:hypothetical protein
MLVALVVMLNFADRLVAASGLNITLIVQDVPAAKLPRQLFVWENHDAQVPVMVILITE